MYVPQYLLLALIIFKKYMWVNKIYIRSKKLCYKIKDQPRVRFGRTFAEVSDKEWPKVRFGWVSDNAQVRSITNYHEVVN